MNARYWSLLLVLFFLSNGILLARDITNITGKVYRDIQVKRVDATGVYFHHSKGLCLLPFNELLDNDKKEFGSDPVKMEQYQAEVNRLEQERKSAENQKKESSLQNIAKSDTDNAPSFDELQTRFKSYTEKTMLAKDYTQKSYFPVTRTEDSISGDRTATGKTIHTGPRGGRYHYSSSGKKVYERKRR